MRNDVKTQAQAIFDRIGDGHRNAVRRPYDLSVDRALRRLIETANHNGDCIIQREDGEGYYRPIPTDPVDSNEFKIYLSKELSRIRKIELKEMTMRVAYEARET